MRSEARGQKARRLRHKHSHAEVELAPVLTAGRTASVLGWLCCAAVAAGVCLALALRRC